MTLIPPTTEDRIEALEQRIEELEEVLGVHVHSGVATTQMFPEDVSAPTELQNAPLTTISDPTGGSTIDAEARTAIDTIIDRLQSLGLIS